jgi:ribosome maturation factor RimP
MKEKFLQIARETCKTLGFLCLEARLLKGKGSAILRLVIAKPEGNIKMEDCTSVSNVVLRRLELDFPNFSEKYDLVVESPGADRKLSSLEEVLLFQGKEVRFVLKNEKVYGLAENVLIGKPAGAEGQILKVSSGNKIFEIDWKDVSGAKLYFDIKKYL